MKQHFLPGVVILLICGITACSPAPPVVEEFTPTFEQSSVEFHRLLNAQIGLPRIDQILEAVANRDLQTLHSFVEFTSALCTRLDGLGGPPKCREGGEEGTVMEVLPFLGSEGSFIRKEEISSWTGIDASGVYAIYEVSSAVAAEQYYPAGRYVILFVGDENQPATAVRIGDNGIVRVDTIFDSSPESLRAMLDREASMVLLPPKS